MPRHDRARVPASRQQSHSLPPLPHRVENGRILARREVCGAKNSASGGRRDSLVAEHAIWDTFALLGGRNCPIWHARAEASKEPIGEWPLPRRTSGPDHSWAEHAIWDTFALLGGRNCPIWHARAAGHPMLVPRMPYGTVSVRSGPDSVPYGILERRHGREGRAAREKDAPSRPEARTRRSGADRGGRRPRRLRARGPPRRRVPRRRRGRPR